MTLEEFEKWLEHNKAYFHIYVKRNEPFTRSDGITFYNPHDATKFLLSIEPEEDRCIAMLKYSEFL